ncbi:LuxR C-terminal-related transcriptional regulator [Bradyrhizobium sp. RDT10]
MFIRLLKRARGYLLKRSAGDELLRAIRAVNQGAIYLDPAIAEKASTKAPELALASEGDGGELSRREEDVLKLVAQGFSNKQIAGQLEVSVKSVETYKARASEKKGCIAGRISFATASSRAGSRLQIERAGTRG